MKKYADTIVTVALAFVVTLVMNTGLAVWRQNRGTMVIGDPIIGGSVAYRPVDISNDESDPLDGVIISVPRETDLGGILASRPVHIDDLPDNTGTLAARRIKISGIEPGFTTRLLLPIPELRLHGQVEAINPVQVNLDTRKTDATGDRLTRALRIAASSAGLYALVVGVFAFWGFAYQERLRAEARLAHEEFTKKQEALGRKADQTKSELLESQQELAQLQRELQGTWARLRILFVARLSDYRKELDFWRDTIRKVLYTQGRSEQDREALIREVTMSLKTYGTSSQAEDFPTIQAMALLLARADQEKTQPMLKPEKE
jgi:hypothetical protein